MEPDSVTTGSMMLAGASAVCSGMAPGVAVTAFVPAAFTGGIAERAMSFLPSSSSRTVMASTNSLSQATLPRALHARLESLCVCQKVGSPAEQVPKRA